jgi:hypothetical protein
MDRIESVSMSVSGGIPGCIQVPSDSTIGTHNNELTVASCANNFGVSLAQAFTAIVPSVGSSAVIVLRAINPCHLKSGTKDNRGYLDLRCHEVLRLYLMKTQ